MTVREETGSGTMARILDRVDARHEELSWLVTEHIAADIGEYGPIDRSSPFWGDVRTFGDSQIRGAMKAARTGEDPDQEDLAVIRAATVRRVAQGVPLQAIHHAFRLGHRIVWNAVMEEADLIEGGRASALSLTLPFMRFVDAVCTCIAETYLNEQHRAARAADRAARDLLELLVAGDPRAGQVAATEGIALDLSRSHVVVVASVADGSGQDGLRRLGDAIESELDGLHVLTVIRQDEVTSLVPAERSDPAHLHELLSSPDFRGCDPSGHGFRIGIGFAGVGVEGIAESHTQARSALAVGSDEAPVVSLSNLSILEYLVSREDRVAGMMVPRAVRDLASGRSAMDRALRETLFVYLGAGMNVLKTAARLPAHPNTVRYRLDRLGDRTGHDPRDLGQMVELAIGVRLSSPRFVEGRGEVPASSLDFSRWRSDQADPRTGRSGSGS